LFYYVLPNCDPRNAIRDAPAGPNSTIRLDRLLRFWQGGAPTDPEPKIRDFAFIADPVALLYAGWTV
jgi:hypothetical protein